MITVNIYVNGELTFTSKNIRLNSFSLNRYSSSAVAPEFGNVSAGELLFTIDTSTTEDTVSRGDIIEVEVVDEETYDVGEFVVTGVNVRQGAFDVTCLDRMVDLDGVANLSGVTYPLTASAFINQIYGTGLGIDIEISESVHNPTIDDPVFQEGVTYRQVLSKVVECMGANAWYTDRLNIGWYEDAEVSYTDSDYFYADLTEQGFDISVEVTDDVTLSPVEIDDNGITLRIVGNEFLANKTSAERTAIANAIKSNIGTVEWYGGNATVLPNLPYLMPMNVVEIDGKSFPVTSVTHGINENIKIESKITKDDNTYNYTPQREIALVRKEIENVEENNKHFFYRDDSGVHITMLENRPNEGRNIKMDSLYMYIRNEDKVLSKFGEDTQIGADDSSRLILNNEGIRGLTKYGARYFSLAFNGNEEQSTGEESIDWGTSFNSVGEWGKGINGDWVRLFLYADSYIALPKFVSVFSDDSNIQWTLDGYTSSKYVVSEWGGWNQYILEQNDRFTVGTEATITKIATANKNNAEIGAIKLIYHYDGEETVTVSFYTKKSSTTTTEQLLQVWIYSAFTYDTTTSSPIFTFGTREGADNGDYSATFGQNLYAPDNGQFVIGRYNRISDEERGRYAFIIGNGSPPFYGEENTSNALTVDWEGNLWVLGDIKGFGGLSYVYKNYQNDVSGVRGITLNARGGIYGKDKTNFVYPYIIDNGTNLWIGATETQTQHHTGQTFISAGYDNTNNKGNDTVIVSVPNATNTGATHYNVWHSGNLPITKASGITGITIGSGADTTQMVMFGTTATKVSIGARNSTDNKRYDLRGLANGIGLYDATGGSWLWQLSGLSGTTNIGTLNTTVSNLNTKVGNIGDVVYSNPDAKSIASGDTAQSWVNFGNIKLTAGTWLIHYIVRWNARSGGFRSIGISETSAGSPLGIMANDVQQAVDGAYSFSRVTVVLKPTATTTYYLNGMQNSGSALSGTPRCTAVRII